MIDKNTLINLQHLWDTRNLIVHSQGVASAAFAKDYARTGIKAGEKVNVNLGMFQYWLAPTKVFIERTDTFFLAYRKDAKKSPSPSHA